MELEIYCLRHGETLDIGCLIGSSDSELSTKGWQQMEDSCLDLNHLDQIISSPLKRCVNFAQSWSHRQKLPLQIVNEIREIDFGVWDGQALSSLWESYPEQMKLFYQNPWHHPPPKAESGDLFTKRVIDFLQMIIQHYPNKSLLLITHAGVIRTLIAWCLELPMQKCLHIKRLTIDYGTLTLLKIYYDDQSTDFWPTLCYCNHRPR